jgi:hypothetical protein
MSVSCAAGTAPQPFRQRDGRLVLFLTCLLAIPLAGQCGLDTLLFARLQVVGVTLDFLDDVLLLYLPLEPAQRIFERLAFLYTNFCQRGLHLQTCQRGCIYDT